MNPEKSYILQKNINIEWQGIFLPNVVNLASHIY